MKRSMVLCAAMLMLAGCGKQQQSSPATGQTGSVSQGYSDVLDEKSGYIIENARLTPEGGTPVFSLDGQIAMSEGSSSLMVIRTPVRDGGMTVLVLEFNAFAPGSAVDFGNDGKKAQFWVMGERTGTPFALRSGVISGALHFAKKEPAEARPDLKRDVLRGTGSMEIVVSNIVPGGLKLDTVKKYAAEYRLPIITLKELAALNTAS